MFTRREKGFTLIELMIVVAIIGILAAIAIPQFASYRLKAFNATAVSDLRNLSLVESAIFADYQMFGSTALIGNAGTQSGVIVSGNNAVIATPNAGEERSLALSNNVKAIAGNDANSTTFSGVVKHLQGNRMIAMDYDTNGIYWMDTGFPVGYSLQQSDGISATVNNDVSGLNVL